MPQMPTTSPGVESSPPPKKRRHIRWRRWRRFALGILILFSLAVLLRSWWLPMALRPMLQRQLKTQLQWDLQYETLETDGWSFVEIREAVLEPQTREDFLGATLSRFRVEFNLLDLWEHGLKGIRTIAVQEIKVESALQDNGGSLPPEEEPATLLWLPQWWDSLPQLAVHGLTWKDHDLEILRLDRIHFQNSRSLTSQRQLSIKGDSLQLAAHLHLDSDHLLVDLDLEHLRWNANWQLLLRSPTPDDLEAAVAAQIHLRLPFAAQINPSMAVEDLVIIGKQAGARWTLQGESTEELDPNGSLAATLQALKGDLRFRSDDWPAFGAAWGLPLGHSTNLGQLQTLSTHLQYERGRITISDATLRTDRGTVSATQSRLTLAEQEGMWRIGFPHLEVRAHAKHDFRLPNGRVLPAGGGRWVIQSLQDLLLEGYPRELNLILKEFTWESHDGHQWVRQRGPMELAYSSQGLTIPDWQLQTPAGSLKLYAQVPLSTDGDSAQDTAPWSASLTSDSFDLAALQLIPGIPVLPFSEGLMHGSILLEGSQAAPIMHGDWALRNLQLQPEQFAPGGPDHMDLDLRFAWDNTGLTLHHVHYQDPAISWNASGHLALPIRALNTPEKIEQQWDTLPLRIDGEAQANDNSWISALLPSDSPIRGGELELSISAQGTALNPEFQAQLTADHWLPQDAWVDRLPQGSWSYLLTGSLKKDILDLRGQWEIGGRPWATVQGEIRGPLASHPEFSLHLASGHINPDWMGWQGTAILEADLTGAGETLAMDVQFNGTQLQPLGTGDDQTMPPFDLLATMHWDQEAFEIVDLRATGELMQGQATGALGLPLQPSAWPSLSLPDLPLQASIQGQIGAMEWLNTLPSLRRAQGKLGFQATIEGPLGDPQWHGQVDLERGAFRLTDPGLPPLEDLELHATIGHEGLHFQNSHGALGAAPFTLTGGMHLQNDGSLFADLSLQGEDLLLYRTSGLKIRADSALTIRGNWPQLIIAGNLVFKDSRLVQNIPLLRSPIGPPRPPSPSGLTLFRLSPPLDQLTFAVDLSAEPGLQLRSNLARGQMRPQLRLEGTGAVPVLRGEVFLDEVSMALPAARLYLQPSVARFLEDDPFHPQLELLGRSSLYGYEVQVVVTGPYDQPQVLLSSSPPLPESDILVLLTTGQLPANRINRRAAASTVALYLARDFLTTFFGNDSIDAEESLLDRIEINFGRDQTRNGAETLNGRLRLGDHVLREGDQLFLEGGRDAFEDYFLGLELLLRFQ